MLNVAGVEIVERNNCLIISAFFFTTTACLAVCLRLLTRAVLVRNFGLDDYLITAAMFGTIGFLVAVIQQIRFGLGDRVDIAVIKQFLQSRYASILAYGFTHQLVNFSILFQYKRIFTERSAQRLFLGLILWLTVYGLFHSFSLVFTCVPVAKYWDETIPGGCLQRSTLHYFLAGFNIINDIILLIAPVPYLNNLQIPRRAKHALMAVFACGGFASIVAIIRLHSLYVNSSTPTNQQPLKGVNIAIWSGLEINVAIICASVPALKPLFVKFFPQMISFLGDSAKRSRTGRSAQNSAHHRSDHHNTHQSGDHDDKPCPIEIEVQSFEMRAVATERDDDSQKDLVPKNGPVWTA
ncbi:hypothetical protein HIM_09622 [Hirsutella minnesotensis 3608]|uniref:Rhodopsin domain-containing protein n=1 Tax=Hirsutella minnesotensis 3608 TaxID=1043627 RepID=A0A0F7ZXM2_9HYPO|nr:hypothetical protein HIM_09622 [Hirsutella minnesotensis 3608]